MAKVYAPNKAYNGITATVRFLQGEGETDNPKLLKWFEKKGYRVVKEQSHILTDEKKVDESVQVSDENVVEQNNDTSAINDYEKMNVEELKELAKSMKIKGYSSMLRPDLIKALMAKKGE
ncbi:Rho termination factor N-terminal domain-containing protein [Lysinibacillus sp. C5.1]|uniref:Rho termination factor N-terminal domain-containing protein n=1 Tax=Lysinibacillus sp. C5.1 TaxID=2796169 RepID=UPI003081AA98